MSRRGNYYDNAVVERFFGNLKSECIGNKKFWSRSEAEQEIRDYIVMFYNKERMHSALGYISPVEYEKLNP